LLGKRKNGKILVNGTDAGTGFAQLQASGPIDLGSSNLQGRPVPP
jgi:hypothetical protein